MKKREIKFRCLGLESKKWHYYDEIQGRSLITPDEHCSESSQYTGLKDKNGVEIYEGDILDFRHHPAWTKKIRVVLFCAGSFSLYKYFRNSKGRTNCLTNAFLKGYMKGFQTLEVIGNIYENPELLK